MLIRGIPTIIQTVNTSQAVPTASRTAFRLLLALLPALLPATAALAHDDPARELTAITRRLESEPESAALYLQRAELHRARHEWQAALADLQAASSLDPSMAAVDLALARMLLEAENLPAALDAAERFSRRSPGNVRGHLVKARILLASGEKTRAAAAFTRAIDLDHRRRGDSSGVQPDDFLDRARALAGTGRTNEAIEGLDEGLALLGNPVTLQLLAIELEQERGNVDGALARIASLQAVAKRKETWAAKRGDVLAAAGRRDEAARAYREALESLTALPPRARDNAQTAELEASLRRKLAGMPTAAAAKEDGQ